MGFLQMQRSYIAHRTNCFVGAQADHGPFDLTVYSWVNAVPSESHAEISQVKNLEERVKIPVLIESLRDIFSEYGNIIDIIAKKSLKRKGQAFIVYDSVDSAQNAIDEINGFELHGKQMNCEFAKTKSDATVEREGTAADLEQHKRNRIAEKGHSHCQ